MAGGFCVLSVSPAPWLACSPSLTHRHTHTCVSFSLSHPLSVTIPHSTQSMIWVTWFSSRALGPMQEGEKKDKKKKTEGRFYEGHPCWSVQPSSSLQITHTLCRDEALTSSLWGSNRVTQSQQHEGTMSLLLLKYFNQLPIVFWVINSIIMNNNHVFFSFIGIAASVSINHEHSFLKKETRKSPQASVFLVIL